MANDLPDRLSEPFDDSTHLDIRSDIVELVCGEELVFEFRQLKFDFMNLFFIEVYALLFIVHCSFGFEN